MKKLMILMTLFVLALPSLAKGAERQKVNLTIDCHTSSSYRSIIVPEGKKATRFRLVQPGYVPGEECGFEIVEDDPKTQMYNEAKEWQKKWDNRTPPPYGWGIKGPTGYYYREFNQRGVKSSKDGNYGSLWLAPGKYTVGLRGYRKSSLSLEYWLEPYTPDGAKKPAAAATPAASGTVEKPHASGGSSVSAGKPHPPGAGSASAAKVGPGIWGGVWYTHPGTITLTQSGNHVSGSYTLQNGKIKGHIVGNTLVGKWSDAPTYKPPMDAGEAVYKMASDGKSFTVDFRGGYAKDNLPWFKNAWKATRTP